jgi:hypothetical protein
MDFIKKMEKKQHQQSNAKNVKLPRIGSSKG